MNDSGIDYDGGSAFGAWVFVASPFLGFFGLLWLVV